MKLPVLQQIVSELLLKDEATIKLLKEQDFLEGDIFGTDNTKEEYRSVAYENFKRAKNPLASGHVDLILTGAFVDAMQLKDRKNGRYMFGNTDRKRNILKEMYGDNIFGLNQNVFDKYQKDIVAPRFTRAIKLKANIG
jgi:hypothetical protein